MEIIVSTHAILKPGSLAEEQKAIAICKKHLEVKNPAYSRALQFGGGRPTHIPQKLFFHEETPDGIRIPRGFLPEAVQLLREQGIQNPIIQDQTRLLPEVDFEFKGRLRGYQREAVREVKKRYFGTLIAGTGSGKTVMGIYLIAARGQPALVIVPTKELLYQWVDRVESFLGIPRDEIGVVGDGRYRIGERITVGIVNSTLNHLADLAPRFGHIIFDEVHHAGSKSFSEVAQAFDSRYSLGLTATPVRSDGLERKIEWYVGPKRHEVDTGTLVQLGAILQPTVRLVETGFRSQIDPAKCYSRAINELAEDEARNLLIVAEVLRLADVNPGLTLVTSDRAGHCENLSGMLNAGGIKACLLTGKVSAKKRNAVVSELRAGGYQTVVATTQLISEGFDLPGMTNLLFATPLKFEGKIVQTVGRILRPAEEKNTPMIIDFVDSHGVFQASSRHRLKVYAEQGYRVLPRTRMAA